MKPIVTELKKLKVGIRIDPEIITYTSFYVVSAVFDKPAKSAVLNMISYNGFGGCTKCLQLGETKKLASGIIYFIIIK